MKKIYYGRVRTLVLISLLMICISSMAQSPTGALSKKEAAKWYKGYEVANGCKLKPHKSTNQIAFSKEYFGNKALWDKTFLWLKSNDLNTLAPGRYVIEEGNSTATVSEAPAPLLENVKWEIHQNFNDIQYIIKGKALMGVVPVEKATLTDAYDSKRDIGFYEAEGAFYDGEPGTFFIFTPADVHRPGAKADGFDVVKKVVIKVRAIAQ